MCHVVGVSYAQIDSFEGDIWFIYFIRDSLLIYLGREFTLDRFEKLIFLQIQFLSFVFIDESDHQRVALFLELQKQICLASISTMKHVFKHFIFYLLMYFEET